MSGIPSSHPTFEGDEYKPTEEEMEAHEATKARDTISDGKYVVFKVDEFYAFVISLWDDHWRHNDERSHATIEEVAIPHVVMDATVLRDQDILTAPALNSYADAALTVHDILLVGDRLDDYPELIERADFFRARAMRAQQAPNRRLPD